MIDRNLINSGVTHIENILSTFSTKDLTKVTCYAESECKTKVRSFSVIFPLGFFLHAYSLYPKNKQPQNLQLLVQQVLDKLESEKKSASYNYFTRIFAKKHSEFMLPDDLDDTVLISSALMRITNTFDEKVILKIIGLETDPGGPYITWYVPPEADKRWRDVDPVVNAHLLYFVSLLNIKLPQTRKYLKECIQNDQLSSVYYPSKYFALFNLAKYFSITNDEEIKELILLHTKEDMLTTLDQGDRVLYLLIKLYCNEELSDKEEKFIQGMIKNVSFPVFPICLDFTHQNNATYTTNKAVSLSLYLEILLLIQKQSGTINVERSTENQINTFIKIVEEKIFLDTQTSKLLEENIVHFPIMKHTKAIVLPLLILQEFTKTDIKQHQAIIETFILSSYYGWIGYTMLDELIDTGKFSSNLIISNSFLRKHHFYLEVLLHSNPVIQKFALDAFDTTDNHYLKQIESINGKKRLIQKDTKYIEERMNGYLTMLSLLPSIVGVSDQIIQKDIYNFVKALVIIDQLNDDAHDWEIDFKEKNETLVTYYIKRMSAARQKYKETFWTKVIKIVNKICTEQYDIAFNIIQKYHSSAVLFELLEKSYLPIKTAAEESKKVKRLMRYYSRD